MKALQAKPDSSPWKTFSALVRLGVWGAAICLMASSWVVNKMLLAAPRAYQNIHAGKVWYPLEYADDEVQNFLGACYEARHWSVAPWPVRLMVKGEFQPTREHGHRKTLSWMFLYRWTLDAEIRREIAFNRTLPISPQSRRLTLENYLFIAGEMRIRKQQGLVTMLRRGELSPARFRELNALLEQAFPDRHANNW